MTTDIPHAQLLPGIPFEAKARKKRRKGVGPARASTLTPPFADVRPFLTFKPLRGLTSATEPAPAPTPPEPTQQRPAEPGTDHDENIAA